jgi:endonuclease/exonuclease/phosphatase family metal-dependent hydrolase
MLSRPENRIPPAVIAVGGTSPGRDAVSLACVAVVAAGHGAHDRSCHGKYRGWHDAQIIARHAWHGCSSRYGLVTARMRGGDVRVRLVTWNLRDGQGPWQDRAPLVLGTLAELWPDVACLQGTWRAGDLSHADFLASELAMEAVFRVTRMPGAAAGSGAGAPGVAILGRWPVTRAWCHALPHHAAAGASTMALTVTFDHPSGPLHVTTAVLDGEQEHAAVRLAQARALAALLAEPALDGPAPVILAADLGVAYAGPEFAALMAVLTDNRAAARPGCQGGRAWTTASRYVRAAGPPADGSTGHILIRPGGPQRPAEVEAAWLTGTEDLPGSGHCALVVDLTWPLACDRAAAAVPQAGIFRGAGRPAAASRAAGKAARSIAE